MTQNELKIEIYRVCSEIAFKNNQVVGVNRDYYITLYQLEWILKSKKREKV